MSLMLISINEIYFKTTFFLVNIRKLTLQFIKPLLFQMIFEKCSRKLKIQAPEPLKCNSL